MTPQLKSEADSATILVIDDERDVRETISEVLEDAGFNVVCAEHGIDALAKLTRIPPPAAILLDLFMPEMNGWRFAEQLKHRGSLANVPIIVVTAAGPHWGTPVPKERVLRKPFQRANLLRLLEQAIHST